MEAAADDGGDERQERCGHAERAYDVERLASEAVNEGKGQEREGEVGEADDDGGEEGSIDSPAGGAKDRWRVVDDGVDAGDVDEDGEDEADGDRATDAGLEKDTPIVAAPDNCGSDLGDLEHRVPASADAFENLKRFSFAAHPHEVAGSFWDEEEHEKEGCRRVDSSEVHPAPVIDAGIAEQEVHQVADEDAVDDGHLVEGPESASHAGRGNLRDVDGREDGDGSHSNAAEQPREDEGGEGGRDAGGD